MTYWILYAFAWLIAWLPLRALYLFSDFAYLIVYYIIGYRKKVVRENLKNSFPEKSEKELRMIEKRFYHFFCDIFIEAIKKMHISESQMRRRFALENAELLNQYFEHGKSIVFMTSHYGNWEWFTTASLFLLPQYPVWQIYKRLNNKNFDRFMLVLRSKFRTRNIEAKTLLRQMVNHKNTAQIGLYGFLSDQSPNRRYVKESLQFLSQRTPVLTGAEDIAKKFDVVVVYGQVTRKKRGYYGLKAIPISLQPSETQHLEITRKYFELLEKDIKNCPELWLWTHKRWKNAKRLKNID
jgi:KDO2-lipid IV(A) lauroyltransferase